MALAPKTDAMQCFCHGTQDCNLGAEGCKLINGQWPAQAAPQQVGHYVFSSNFDSGNFGKVSRGINMEENGHVWGILAVQWSLGGVLACVQPGQSHEFRRGASTQERKQG